MQLKERTAKSMYSWLYFCILSSPTLLLAICGSCWSSANLQQFADYYEDTAMLYSANAEAAADSSQEEANYQHLAESAEIQQQNYERQISALPDCSCGGADPSIDEGQISPYEPPQTPPEDSTSSYPNYYDSDWGYLYLTQKLGGSALGMPMARTC